jgi:hypothetical protein
LNTLGELALIEDADAIWKNILEKRDTVSKRFFDAKARKINTDWVDAIDPAIAKGFKWTPPR